MTPDPLTLTAAPSAGLPEAEALAVAPPVAVPDPVGTATPVDVDEGVESVEVELPPEALYFSTIHSTLSMV